jgi:hypothetical protein
VIAFTKGCSFGRRLEVLFAACVLPRGSTLRAPAPWARWAWLCYHFWHRPAPVWMREKGECSPTEPSPLAGFLFGIRSARPNSVVTGKNHDNSDRRKTMRCAVLTSAAREYHGIDNVHLPRPSRCWVGSMRNNSGSVATVWPVAGRQPQQNPAPPSAVSGNDGQARQA